MNTSRPLSSLRTALLLLSGLVLFASRSPAQEPALTSSSATGLWDVPSSQSVFDSPPPPSSPSTHVPRLRLFRFAPGFLTDPLDLQEEDCDLPGVPKMASPTLSADTNDGPGWIQVGMGSDNPFFDLRRPGDPGGIGYYRVNTQVALLDSSTTSCTFGVQAVTPAGVQFAGVPNGPTVLCPAFSVFHALTDNLGFQGFVSRYVPINSNTNSTSTSNSGDGAPMLQRNFQYGLALQRPLVASGPEGLRNLFVTVGALGTFAPDHDTVKPLPNYDVLPGLQWHVNDNWWVSSGVLVPVGPVRSAPGQWQLTCSLRF